MVNFRTFLILIAFGLSHSIWASPTPPKDIPVIKPDKPPKEKPPDGEFEITKDTKIFLDGKMCESLKDIPEGSEVESAEVDKDKKTILSIHFRTPK